MRRFIIERELQGAGTWSAEQLRDVSHTSVGVLRDMGPGIQWLHSFVTADRMYCIYLAESERMIREHGKRGGFPCTTVSEIIHVIDPMTANAPSV